MTRSSAELNHTGPIGPVAISGAALLLVASPLMRGGNRQVALLALELIATITLLGLLLGATRHAAPKAPAVSAIRKLLTVFVLASPVWLALVYLVPIPVNAWTGLPGRDVYLPLLGSVGIESGRSLPLSLAPDATLGSLLAGIPLIAAFLVGSHCRPSQLKLLFRIVLILAFLQLLLGLFQVSGGPSSQFYFGVQSDRPVGTFANANHLANYFCMALALLIWLAWDGSLWPGARSHQAMALWTGAGVLLIIGVLLTRSRGAASTGLPIAMAAASLALSASGRPHSWQKILALVGTAGLLGITVVGIGSVTSRFDVNLLAGSMVYRGQLAATTLEGAATFWPWGTGWGTYAAVYPRFQPVELFGLADYAHNDYAQMLFEGGVFAVLLAGAFAVLAVARAMHLARSAWRAKRLDHEEMTTALCGLGLLGFLLHSLVEFNMHIPANAILAALLAGVFLRPLGESGSRS